MCGIAGYIRVPDRLSSIDLSIAITQLNHRGPDDSGTFIDQAAGIGFAHTRLSIQDLTAAGRQPMKSKDGKFVLIFNGEIYNFRELRKELIEKGFVFNGNSDTEVILNLYQVEGSAMLRRLNGVFALALWDADSDTVLLTRDAFGVKPLYYSVSETGVQFASEIKALQSIVHTLDFSALDRYLTFLWCPGEGTPSTQVHKLGPGEAMCVRRGVIQNRFTWFRLPALRGGAEMTTFFDRKVKDELILNTEANLRRAVHRQMVSDVPVGAFLSGGLDSSSIVTFAREQNPDIRCFTIETIGGDKEGITDDLPYAHRVADHLKVRLEVVRVNSSRMAEDLPSMVSQLDEPLADPAALNVLYISQLAREQDIRVLLSGSGGDDLFTGYRRHRALVNEDIWAWLPQSIRLGLERMTNGLDQHRPMLRRLRKLFNGASLEGDARLVNYFRWINRRDLLLLYSTEFRAAFFSHRSQSHLHRQNVDGSWSRGPCPFFGFGTSGICGEDTW